MKKLNELNLGNAFYNADHNLLCPSFQSKNIKIKTEKCVSVFVCMKHTKEHTGHWGCLKMLLRRICGPKKDEVTAGERELHGGRWEIYVNYWSGNLKGRENLGVLGISEGIILKFTLKK